MLMEVQMKLLNYFLISLLLSGAAFSAGSIRKVKLTNDNETDFVEVNSSKELTTTDSPNLGGLDTIINLTVTPVELKVGASAKTNRKYFLLEALTNNVKWGFNTSCNFSLKKFSFYMIPVGENTTVYVKALTGTAQVVAGEI